MDMLRTYFYWKFPNLKPDEIEALVLSTWYDDELYFDWLLAAMDEML
jgi:hypothetical protein